jgi:serine/threonine protein kinase
MPCLFLQVPVSAIVAHQANSHSIRNVVERRFAQAKTRGRPASDSLARGRSATGRAVLVDVTFHGYSDVRQIGQGGLGTLYRARRDSTGGLVAIKELRGLHGSAMSRRARRELDALLQLKGHPYVVSVEEIVDGPHGPCMVMEYAGGGSLADRSTVRGALSRAELIMVGQHVTQALAAAHQLGITHRDVKPDNLLIGSFGQVKLCDFGIAALIGAGDGDIEQSSTSAYASPEQHAGVVPVGPLSDVFSFAVTFVHLARGIAPGADVEPTIWLDQQLANEADAQMVQIYAGIRQALQDDPDERPSMLQLAAAFDAAAGDQGIRGFDDLAGGQRKALRVSGRVPAALRGAATTHQPDDEFDQLINGRTGTDPTPVSMRRVVARADDSTGPRRRPTTHSPGRSLVIDFVVVAVLVAAFGAIVVARRATEPETIVDLVPTTISASAGPVPTAPVAVVTTAPPTSTSTPDRGATATQALSFFQAFGEQTVAGFARMAALTEAGSPAAAFEYHQQRLFAAHQVDGVTPASWTSSVAGDTIEACADAACADAVVYSNFALTDGALRSFDIAGRPVAGLVEVWPGGQQCGALYVPSADGSTNTAECTDDELALTLHSIVREPSGVWTVTYDVGHGSGWAENLEYEQVTIDGRDQPNIVLTVDGQRFTATSWSSTVPASGETAAGYATFAANQDGPFQSGELTIATRSSNATQTFGCDGGLTCDLRVPFSVVWTD